jgi:hypothetical protein
MKELFTALAAAQSEMEAASKDSANPFFKSKYADLNSVMGAVKPAFAKHGLAFIQICHDSEHAAKVETVIIHASGQQFSCGAVSVPVTKIDAQGYGSALTYARRYSLAAAAGVGAEDDDGNAAAKAKPVPISAKSIAQSDWETLKPAQQEELANIAAGVSAELNEKGAEAAVRLLESETEGFDATLKTALWGRFASDEKSAMKKTTQRKAA